MQRIRTKNGFSTIVFSKGDGMRVRWAEHLQKWKAAFPVKRKLTHRVDWYLDADRMSKRPLYGLQSLAILTERLLWDAFKRYDGNSREVAVAQHAFLAVRRKIAQMRYRGSGTGYTRAEYRYLRSSVANCIVLANKAARLVRKEDYEGT